MDGDELVFTEGSTYTPPHRSPLAIALFDNPVDGSWVLELEARQTGRDYGHRDLCVFFDWQDWHDLRIERDYRTGSIRDFFDGTLVMKGTDPRFGPGKIGLGSIDDQGRFRHVHIRALR